MKKIFIMMSILLLTLTATAKRVQYLCLTASDGTEAKLALSESLIISFDNGNMIATDGTQTVQFDVNTLNISYEDGDPSAINEVTDDKNDKPRFQKNTISFDNLPSGTPVQVYSADGRLQSVVKANGGITTIHLEQLKKGTNLIKAGKYSIKYLKP